jgi:hypothetical protein
MVVMSVGPDAVEAIELELGDGSDEDPVASAAIHVPARQASPSSH